VVGLHHSSDPSAGAGAYPCGGGERIAMTAVRGFLIVATMIGVAVILGLCVHWFNYNRVAKSELR
jgi:hypothetical protein